MTTETASLRVRIIDKTVERGLFGLTKTHRLVCRWDTPTHQGDVTMTVSKAEWGRARIGTEIRFHVQIEPDPFFTPPACFVALATAALDELVGQTIAGRSIL